MAKILLNGTTVVTIIGELVAGGVMKHLRMNREFEVRIFSARAAILRTSESVIGRFRSVTKRREIPDSPASGDAVL